MDTMDLLGDLTSSDANLTKPLFKKDEIVEFVVIDLKVTDKTAIIINTKVLTGEHTGKPYTIFIPEPSNDVRRKQRAAFFFQSGVWTAAELQAKDVKIARLMGRKLQGKAGLAKKGKDNAEMTFQDIMNIKDLGATDMPAGNGAAATPAQVAAGQTSF